MVISTTKNTKFRNGIIGFSQFENHIDFVLVPKAYFGDCHEKYAKWMIFTGKSILAAGGAKMTKETTCFCVFRGRCPQGWKKAHFHENHRI